MADADGASRFDELERLQDALKQVSNQFVWFQVSDEDC